MKILGQMPAKQGRAKVQVMSFKCYSESEVIFEGNCLPKVIEPVYTSPMEADGTSIVCAD